MSNSLPCPKCDFSNNLSAKFCNQCATSLVEKTQPCYNCEAPNKLDAVYCQNCASKVSGVLPGLTIKKAKEWNQVFVQLGWLNKRTKLEEYVINLAQKYFRENNLEMVPNIDEREPIILPLTVTFTDSTGGRPLNTVIEKKLKISLYYNALLLITRCRIRSIVLSLTGIKTCIIGATITDFWYKDITNYNWEESKGGEYVYITLQTKSGDSISLAAQLPKLSFVHLGNLLVSNDTFSRYKSDQILNKQTEDRYMVASLIGKFVEEIAEVASQA